MVFRPSGEAELRGLALGVCEGLWRDRFSPSTSIWLYCDNKSAFHMTHNPVNHDGIKHVEIDRFFIKEKLEDKKSCEKLDQNINLWIFLLKQFHFAYFQNLWKSWA